MAPEGVRGPTGGEVAVPLLPSCGGEQSVDGRLTITARPCPGSKSGFRHAPSSRPRRLDRGPARSRAAARLPLATGGPERQDHHDHRRHRLVRQGLRQDGLRRVRPQEADHLLARRAQTVRDGPELPARALSVHALFHRRRARRRAAADGHARGRLRDPRRGPEAGADRRVQSLRVHQDKRPGRRECGERLHRRRGEAGRGPVDRQGGQSDQSVRRLQAGGR